MQTSSLATRDYSDSTLTAADVSKISKRIRDVHVEHRNTTGERLSIDGTIAKWIDKETSATADSLDPAVSAKIRTYLAGLYTPRSIDRVLAVVAANGTTECGLDFLTPDDRKAVEDLLPEAPESAWKGPRRNGLLWGGMVAKDGVWAN